MHKKLSYAVIAALVIVMSFGSLSVFAETEGQGTDAQQNVISQPAEPVEDSTPAAEPEETAPATESVVKTAPAAEPEVEAAPAAEPEDEEVLAVPAEEEPEDDTVHGVTGWVTRDGHQRYYYADGAYYKDTLVTISGHRYAFDENGYLKHWLFSMGGFTYYANGKGVIVTSRFMNIKGQRYYFNKYGAANMGFFYVDGNRYFGNRNGTIRKWMFTEGGKTYYANSYGVLVRNKFMNLRGNRYYFGSDGAAKTGFYYVGSNRYFGNSDGSIRKWLFKEGGFTYYANGSGVITRNRFLTIKGNRYYFNKHGAANMGVYAVNGTYYYANSNGVIRTTPGRFTFRGKMYMAKSNGQLYRNQFVLAGGYAYYADNAAVVRTSTFTYKDAFNPSGVTLHPNKEGQISMSEYGKLNMSGAPAAISMETYVLVDIGDQKLYLYEGGRCVLKTSVVTGRTSGGAYGKTHGTPTGTFYINSGKTTGTHLKGLEDDGKTKYDSYVNYWMPFTWNGYGLHDATWRGSFGGSIYITSGSHGCVNMPLSAARTVYYATRVGTMVKIQY